MPSTSYSQGDSGNNGDKEGNYPSREIVIDDPALRGRIGMHLGELRRKAGLSQRRVAGQVGFSRPHLSNVEMGRTRASWEGLQRMADVYQKNVRDIAEELSGNKVVQWTEQAVHRTALSLAGGTATARNPELTLAAQQTDSNGNLTRDERIALALFRSLSEKERGQFMSELANTIIFRPRS